MEHPGIHLSLWKPFRVWLALALDFSWAGASAALQSVTSWCQNWSSGAAPARSAGAGKMGTAFDSSVIFTIFDKTVSEFFFPSKHFLDFDNTSFLFFFNKGDFTYFQINFVF